MVLAATGVFGTDMAWPNLVVAGIMTTLGISGGAQIIFKASIELSPKNTGYAMAAK